MLEGTGPLSPGDPLTLWRVGRTVETAYDIADQPMDGAMDPFFFVTDTKNFIPHEYPCRTHFAAAHRGKPPVPNHAFEPVRSALPFGAPGLDLSGFWFRATHIATWAETAVTTPGGTVDLTLTTPGGALVMVDGAVVGHAAHYVRNLAQSITLTVSLSAGAHKITVYFDDLAERDTRHTLTLAYAGGAPLAAINPFDAPDETVSAVANALSTMHFERPFVREGAVRLIFPEPLPADVSAEIVVEGDFMSHERLPLSATIPAGARAVTVADVEALPADFRHFRIRLTMGSFSAERTLGLEVCPAAPPAPTTLPARIEEALHHVAEHAEPDTVCALARLAAGRAGAATEAMIAQSLPRIRACWDCADFALVPLLWARMAYGAQLTTPLRAEIDATILSYRYWMDEPGNDVQWYFSENHALLFHTAAHLAGTLLPDATFARSGRTGREQAAVGASRLAAWFDHFERWEMAEFNSAAYFPIDLKGLLALFALSPDAALRARAGKAAARLITQIAKSAHHGTLTAAQGRSYEHTLRGGETAELTALSRLLWGVGGRGARVHALPQLALALRDHGLTLPDEAALAHLCDGTERGWHFAQGENHFARLTHAKTADWALGTAATYRWFQWGYQETLLQGRIGRDPQAQIVINHPGEGVHCGYGRPSFWGGSASIPRVQQYRGLAIVVFDGLFEQLPFTHALFPRAAFDQHHVAGPIAEAASGAGRMTVVGSAPLTPIETGPSAGVELRMAGRDGRWIVRLHRGEADFSALSLTGPSDGPLLVDDPVYGPVHFGADGTVAAEGTTIDPRTFPVEGVTSERPA
ncbi:MAG: hypothetical protein AAF318_12825 [Pseudomonadota bacterium]